MNAPEGMTIVLDGSPHRLQVATPLTELVASLGHPPNAICTAVNGVFVARNRRDGCLLQADDAVLLFRPITGG